MTHEERWWGNGAESRIPVRHAATASASRDLCKSPLIDAGAAVACMQEVVRSRRCDVCMAASCGERLRAEQLRRRSPACDASKPRWHLQSRTLSGQDEDCEVAELVRTMGAKQANMDRC